MRSPSRGADIFYPPGTRRPQLLTRRVVKCMPKVPDAATALPSAAEPATDRYYCHVDYD